MIKKQTPRVGIRKSIAILAVLLLLMATLPVASAANNWNYRRPITISNSGDALSYYQVKVHITDTSKMQDNGADLRFTNEANTVKYPYWVESWATNDAYVWVNVSSIPTGNSTMYMWYNNSEASSESDGDATFEFFDNFSGIHTLSDYTKVDNGSLEGPSDWELDTVNKKIIQHRNIFSGIGEHLVLLCLRV